MASRPLSAALLILLGACTNSGGGLKVIHNPPSATIVYPGEGDVVEALGAVTFTGEGSDIEDGFAVTATWLVDGVEVCAENPVDEDGTSTCTTTLEPGSYTISLKIKDSDGETATDSVSVVAEPTNAPEVEIAAPDGTGLYYSDQAIDFEGFVDDAETPSEDLLVVWSSDVDGPLDIDDSPSSTGQLEGAATLSEGTHLVTLAATDADGLEGSATVLLEVMGPNVAPDCEITAPTEGSSGDNGALVDFEGLATDPNVDPTLLSVEWESDLDGVLASGAPDASGVTGFSTDTLTVGTHAVSMTVTDDRGETCVATVHYSVGSPPEVSIDAPSSGELYNEGDTVAFAATGRDNESIPSALSVDWVSDLDGPLSSTPLTPSTTDDAGLEGTAGLSLDSLSAGTHTISAQIVDSDGLYDIDTISLQINDLPSAPGVTISPASPGTGDDLTASVTTASTDLEGDTMSYAYSWTVDGAASGVAAAVVPSASTTRGEVWEVSVTPNDGHGDGAVGTASITIGNTLPVVDVAPVLAPDPAYESSTLTCAMGSTSDADGDSVTDAVSWKVNGIVIGTTSTTLTGSAFSAGDAVTCTQTPSDGYGSGTPMDSNTVTIANTAPTVSAVSITPDPGYAASTLTCNYTWSDIDGDADGSTVNWFINGTSAGTGGTLTGGFVHGDTVGCTVNPHDGTDAGTPVSASLTVSNTAPVLASVSLTPTTADTGDTLTCTAGSTSDDDGESVSLSYTWTINGTTVATTGTTLSSGSTAKDDAVVCIVTPNDGTDDGAAVSSNTVTIANTPPVMSSVSLAPTSPMTDDTLTATVSSSDADGDSVTYSYAWYVNGSWVGTTGSGSLAGSVYFDKGDTIYVEVTPNDGDDDGAPLSSSTITAVNSPPEAPELAFSPSSPGAGVDAIVCEIDTASVDADGDTVSYTFSWTADGVAYPSGFSGATGPSTTTHTDDTIPAADSDLALDWICTVETNDGTDDGGSESALVTVLDVTDPDAPVIDTPARYRNSDALTLTGSCDATDCVTVEVDCFNTTDGSFTDTDTCASDTWGVSFSGLARDETTTCVATCIDAAGNESGFSNTVNTDVCEPWDEYEDAAGYGDASTDPIDEWAAISDDGASTITVQANILEDDSVDWYVIESGDDLAADRAANLDEYAFEVQLLDPTTGSDSTVYSMTVYKGSDASGDLECSTTTGGYTHYTDYVYDAVEGYHSAPADRRACGNSSASYNDCEDRSETYYVKVVRVSSSVTSCDGYELSITNGQFLCDSSECPY